MNSMLDYNRIKKGLSRNSQLIMIFGFLAALFIVSNIMNNLFFTLGNIVNVSTTAYPYLLVAFGQTIVILTGGIDLSVGATISVANVICATLMDQSIGGFTIGFSAALLSGIVIGTINALLIVKGQIQPIIATLATQTIFLGVALAIMPKPGGTTNFTFAALISGKLGGIPVVFILIFVTTAFMWIMLNKTRFGYHTYAIGGNADAAYSTGILVGKQKGSVYVIAGLLSALAGIYQSSQMYSGDPTLGANYTMISIAAVVVGGTALTGGKGSVIGTVAGVFIMIVINNFLNLINVSTWYQFVAQGFILIAALSIGALRARRG